MADRLAAVVSTIFDFLAARIQFGAFSFRVLILVLVCGKLAVSCVCIDVASRLMFVLSFR